MHPPSADEASYLNRKQGHSINALAVAGNEIFIYNVSNPDPVRSMLYSDPDPDFFFVYRFGIETFKLYVL